MHLTRAVVPSALFLGLAVLAAGCSGTPSQAEQTLETAPAPAASDLPTAEVLPAPTSLPTTAPVADGPPPGPTPITLSGGRGIQVPATPEAGPTAASDDATATPTAAPTVEPDEEPAPVSEPTPTTIATAPPTSASVPEATATPGEAPEPADPDDPAVAIANGAEVYTLNCARCHGQNGIGSFQASGLYGVGARYSAGQMVTELTSGHPYTFGFGDKLSASEISDVVAYALASFG